MDVKEKLVELQLQADIADNLSENTTQHREFTADFMMANGVTVRDVPDINVGKWISVKDRLPKGGAIVLCNTNYFVEVLQWDERADVWVDQYRNYRKNYVTHWMPLPNAPEVKND